jgi:hypothetical protein
MERLVAGPSLLAKESGKLPTGLLTVSACLPDIVPDSWAIEWANVDKTETRNTALLRRFCRAPTRTHPIYGPDRSDRRPWTARNTRTFAQYYFRSIIQISASERAAP